MNDIQKRAISAEHAATRLEKVKAIQLKQINFMAYLSASLTALGLERLIAEAQEASLAAIKEAGLFEFYKSKT